MVAPLQIVQPGMTRTRKKRSPQFPIAGTMKPFGLYPLWATAVLPGETLNNCETKYRLISMPVKHPLAGAWFETWTVYVALTDISESLATMFISDTQSPTAFQATADQPRYFTRTGQVEYIKRAMDAVVFNYFRDEQEPGWNTRLIDGVHMAGRQNFDWAQNLMFQPATMNPALLPAAMPESGTYTPLEIMKLAGMSEITYEKYLMQYGVVKEETVKASRVPEILRYTREWTLPTNTIEPSNGRPSSAWAWSNTIKSEKPKRFDEPGFVITIGCVRPKMFDPTLRASMIGELWGFQDWFPVYNLEDPAAGIKTIDASHQVLARVGGAQPAATDPLIYDHRDLLAHGEQFVNDWTTQPYRLPQSNNRSLADGATYPNVRHKYPALADVNQLFTESDQGTPAESRMRLYYEGIASAEITGHVVDMTR